MILLVAYDLPTQTVEQRRIYRNFRKHVLEDSGFISLQESLYFRWCASAEHGETLQQNVFRQSPREGKVMAAVLTDSATAKITCICNGEIDDTLKRGSPVERF